MLLFVEYPKCSTCQKARAWLDAQGLSYERRHILEDTPTSAELETWLGRGGLPVKRLWNTSGMLCRSMGLKEKLPHMDEQAQLALLSSDGMLIKRPVLVGESFVLTGFRPDQWAAALGIAAEG